MAKPFIKAHNKDCRQAPLALPPALIKILAEALICQESSVVVLWNALRNDIWDHSEVVALEQEINLFNQCALKFSTSCNRRYHHNYSVHNKTSTRLYYGGVPDVIQAAQHFFMESSVLELIANGMAFAWLSGENSARIYNKTLAHWNPHIHNNPVTFRDRLQLPISPQPWQTSLEMCPEDALNRFFLYSVLLHKAEHGTILILPHNVHSQMDRIKPALQERNEDMEGTGQENYAHACNRCFIVSANEKGEKAHHFCFQHAVEFDSQCAVRECDHQNTPHFLTCDLPEHRTMESEYYQRGKAIFQLQARLRKARHDLQKDSVDTTGDSSITAFDDISCDRKSTAGNRQGRALFSGGRTHNEQLIMRPCGVVTSRATFFGAEAISSVWEFIKATFPTHKSTPKFFVFDNNCKLQAHIHALKDHHFDNTGMPVNVFHFKSKHKLSDKFCQENCNPAAFPELIKAGKWTINTSICEQTNVWFDGYQAIMHDMEVTRYNFFLDEMIKRRNRYVIEELEEQGHEPWSTPISIH
ncbi:hypothetical protein DXG01_002276 [Tephrocybe rancida]|nr:hypothetical protein DXG01_002276 [Tephrocybe rancida]